MRFGSVCSGIEAASVAWRPLGWECAFVSEIERFPSAVLAHHHPDAPNLGDMTKIGDDDLERVGPVDLLVGGTPCQSFSVAGLRKGLDDPRGNLALVFLRILERTRARWVVWENVPGVLSSGGGRDFGAFLGGLGELGYGFAYRVLDAQYFGLAQRRKRVFVVGHLGDWRRAAAVLLERESLSGNPAPRRTTGQGVAASLTRGADSSGKGGYAGRRREDDVNLVAHSLRADGFDAGEDGTGRGVPLVASFDPQGGGTQTTLGWSENGTGALGTTKVPGVIQEGDDASTYEADSASVLRTLRKRLGAEAVAEWGSRVLDPLQSPEVLRAWLHGESIRRASDSFGRWVDDRPLPREEGVPARAMREVWENGPDGRTSQGRGLAKQLAHQLGKALPKLPPANAPRSAAAVRRLTPTECERLMGFPDDYTLVPWRGGMAADGPRYKALGNSMAVPVMRWIGSRVALVEGD